MRKVVALAYAWSQDKIQELDFNSFSNVNILHRDRLAGIQHGKAGHRILCYDPPENIKRQFINFDNAWKDLNKRPKYCVYARFVLGGVPDENGRMPNIRQIALDSDMSKCTFDRNVSRGLRTIQGKLWPR